MGSYRTAPSPSCCGQRYARTADGVAWGAERGGTRVSGEGWRGRDRRWTGVAAVEGAAER